MPHPAAPRRPAAVREADRLCPAPVPGGRVEVLLVEDNPGDVRLIRESFRGPRLTYDIRVAEDGVEALRMLRERGPDGAAPLRPHMILLDLNLPRKDGRQVLAEVKADPLLRKIPVVVLTSSQAEADVASAYDLQANCYVAKPIDLPRFLAVVGSIEEFWLRTVALPPS